MSRIFITGSTDGLGLAAARTLIREGHEVVLHARSRERAAVIAETSATALGLVIGDLASAEETRSVAEQLNAIGRMDAIIHNAGIYSSAAAAKRRRAMPRRWRSTPSRPICSLPGSRGPTA